ncbi:MAG: signal peptidase II, partial [Eubacteriales bacterium]|nr:signal peptidase II [Eubacteriales bacterium]
MKLQEIIRSNMKFAGIASAIFLLDKGIKDYAEAEEALAVPKPALGGRLVLQRYHNRGAFLNLGEKRSALMRALSLGLTAVVLVCFVCTLGQRGRGLLKTGLALLLGGAFSNSYDRLYRSYVVDYASLRTGIRALDRVVFNLADLCIMIGALCTALSG